MKLDLALNNYKRDTKDIPNSKAIEERHELEDKVSKYTKMLHKFETKCTESTLYQLFCLRALTQSTKSSEIGAALLKLDIKSAKTPSLERIEMLKVRCRGLQMKVDDESLLEIIEKAK